MKRFISLSKFPGTTGTYFYNKYFEYHDYPAVYEAHQCNDISEIEPWLKVASGISISMPYKNEVLKYLEFTDSTALYFKSCNTIVVGDHITGYNTDLKGVEYTCKMIDPDMKISILGSGSMATMYNQYLVGADTTVYARSLGNWEDRHTDCDVIINCTGLGTSVPDSPFNILPDCSMIIDLALKPNKLKEQASLNNVLYVSGINFYKQQFLEQFELYTGIKPDPAYFNYIDRTR